MRLDSVRELKGLLTDSVLAPLSAGETTRLRSLSARPASAAAAEHHRSIALGVVRRGAGPGDFKLAVRVQRREMEASPELDLIRQKARGEVDERYVGRLVKLGARRATPKPGGPSRAASAAASRSAAPRRADVRTAEAPEVEAPEVEAPVPPTPATAVALALPWHQQRNRPLRVGGSVGHYRITAGTLGCFVKRRAGAGGASDASAGADRVFILSNNHVLANENNAKAGDAIVQPGPLDGGEQPGDVVAELADFVKLKSLGANTADCAVALLKGSFAYDSANLAGLGKLAGRGPAFLDAGTDVAKVGRTTGATRGRVTAFELDNVIVSFDSGNLRFDGQVEIEGSGDAAFSDGGDSGSLIVDADNKAVALLFAGGDVGGANGKGLTYANPIGTVLDVLKVDLLY